MFSFLPKNSNKILPIVILLIAVGFGGFYFYQQGRIVDKVDIEGAHRVEELSKKLELSKKQEVSGAPNNRDSKKTYEQRFDGTVFASYDGVRHLRVTAPNGGENLCLGQNFLIQWDSNALRAVTVMLRDISYTNSLPIGWVIGKFPSGYNERGEDNGHGELLWRVGENLTAQNPFFPAGPKEGNLFEIYIFSQDNDRLIEDTSDKVFTITNCQG